MSDADFLDEMAATQAHNLDWFKQVVGPAWGAASEVLLLCDQLLLALPESKNMMSTEKVWAAATMLHNAKRAAATGLLSFARCQMMEAQPLFRRYLECFVFARIAWTDADDAAAWLNGVVDEEAYAAYKKRYGKKRFDPALKALDRSLAEVFDGLSKGTHSSFRSMAHTLTAGGDSETLQIGVHYFDVIDPAQVPQYVELLLATVSFLLLCQEAFAAQTFATPEWAPSKKHWEASRTPVMSSWLAVDQGLRRQYALPLRSAPPDRSPT